MAYLDWQPEFAVGHGQIDAEHRTLLDAMNRLHEAADQGQDKPEVAKVLNFLRDYTVSHFSMEEALMVRHKYPGASAHFAAHSDLVMQVSDFIADFRVGNVVGVEAMLAFLRTWLVSHIQVSDKALGAFLQSRGVGA